MRIHIASHLFAPRPQGVFCAELAAHWGRSGHEVIVFTADPGFAGPAGDRPYELVSGLSGAYDRRSLAHRLASRWLFATAASMASARRARMDGRPNVFVSCGLLSAVPFGLRHRSARRGFAKPRVVVWLFDLWPDVLLAHRPASRSFRALAPPLRALAATAMRHADAVVALSPAMALRVGGQLHGPPVRAIPLWAPGDVDEDLTRATHAVAPRPRNVPPVIAYHGNLGLSYDFDAVLAAAARFRPDEARFLLVGDGPCRDAIARRLSDGSLAHVALLPPVPSSDLRASLGAVDVHLLPLRSTWDVVSFPSKLLAYLASGRPVLVIGAEEGESASLVRRIGCGQSAPACAGRIEATLRGMLDDASALAAMGQAARALYDAEFARARAFAAWDALVA